MDAQAHDSSYEAPKLRDLGSVHELTQGGLFGDRSDGLLILVKYGGGGGGGVVNGS